MTVEAGIRELMRECADQIAANIERVWMSDDPEGPHRLRVDLRRLRCLFAIFAHVVRCGELDRLNAEARWLAREVGELRDLDVVRHDIVEAVAEQHLEDIPLSPLAAALAAQAHDRREALCTTLVAPRVQALMLDLTKFVETRGWLAAMDLTQRTHLAMPMRDFAGMTLEKLWRKARKRGRRFKTLGVDKRHRLRKDLKKLRYAIGFFAHLYKAKRVIPIARSVKDLQGIFGTLNDAELARVVLDRPDLASPVDVQAQRAVGWVLGASQARADVARLEAKDQWAKFKRAQPFWR
jgi:triphosphatase